MVAAAHGEKVVLGVAEGLVEGPGAQGGPADAQDHDIPAPFQKGFAHPVDVFDRLLLVGQIHKSQVTGPPPGGQVLVERGQAGGQGVQVGVIEAGVSQELGHGVIVVEAQLHAVDPFGVLVAFHGHLAFLRCDDKRRDRKIPLFKNFSPERQEIQGESAPVHSLLDIPAGLF